MKNPFETKFIRQTIDKTSFVDIPAQKFFAKWCKINDSITPKFVSRQEWSEIQSKGILEKNDKSGLTLFLPTDLHLHEMMDIIKAVDHNTFESKPEKQDKRAEKIKKLGEIFEKAGIYIKEYLPEIQKVGKDAEEIALVISRNFYEYGLSLQQKEVINDESTNELNLVNLQHFKTLFSLL